MSKNIVENSNRLKSIKCYCPICKIDTQHLILVNIYDKGFDKDDGVNWEDDYEIIQCKNCEYISFRKDGFFSEYQDYDNDGTYEDLYPQNKDVDRKQLNFNYLPYNLDKIYFETINAYNKNIGILCAVGIRSIIEGICKDKKISSGMVPENGTSVRKQNLMGQIYGMKEAGIISDSQMNILHELRFLGNKAVHELRQPSMQELSLALDIIEHIVNDIYEIPQKAKILESKRNRKKDV